MPKFRKNNGRGKAIVKTPRLVYIQRGGTRM